jgi:hypothetical protein
MMTSVTRRRLLAALFVYVTLDLALPMMPGAFQFDLDDSVDSAQHQRGRATDSADVRTMIQTPFVVELALDDVLARPLRHDQWIARGRQDTPRCLPRAHPAPPPPPIEDPH